DKLSPSSAAQLATITESCAAQAKHSDSDAKTRVDCIRILGRSPHEPKDGIEILADFLSAENDAQLQTAAVDALAEQTKPSVADYLLNEWHGLTPALRAKVLDVLLTRKQWVGPLLAAIEAKNVQSSEIDAAHQARLTTYPDAELSKKAQTTFAQS